jgi:DNA processing protein
MAEDQFSSHHPTHPPQGEEDRLAWLRLLRSRRVGPATFFRLLGEYGSATAALEALPEVAKAAGVEDYRVCPVEVAMAERKAARLAGARMIAFGEAEYPPELAQIDAPPPILWALGDVALLRRQSVALVGARNASSLGLRMARALSEGLGKAGLVVTSGLARGIDTAAHLAALPTGTIAVMAGGVDVVYPPENAVLAQEIADRGLRLSDQPMGLVPQARHFPRRNRVVAGLARAVVVVEAAAQSGSLITARAALDEGREVMAVPGHPMDARASGCNMLLRDGATLVRGADDVVEALAAGPQPGLALAVDNTALAPVRAAPRPRRGVVAALLTSVPTPTQRRGLSETAALHQRILDRLGPSPLAEDQLIRDLGISASEAGPELLNLELDGRIERRAGGLICLI